MVEKVIKLAVPSKGRLYPPTMRLLNKAGLRPVERAGRALYSDTYNPDVQLILARAADIPKFVESGTADLGITGHDFVIESKARVKEVLDLEYGRAKLVLAVPNSLKTESVNELPSGVKVATKYVGIAEEYFKRLGLSADIVRISGATEIMPWLGVADAIIDVVDTGETLEVHRLKVLDVVMESSARLICNENSYREKTPKIQEIITVIEGVIRARKKKLIMMNVSEKALKDVIKLLPSMAGPTIAKVESKEPMWEVYSVIDEDDVFRVISLVKKAGARDILILPIEKLVP